MRALFSVFLVMLFASLTVGQQANSEQARFYGTQQWNNGPFVPFGWPSGSPGPFVVNIQPITTDFYAYIGGTLNMPAGIYGHGGAPFPGWTTLPGGIVDIDASIMVPVWEGVLALPNATPGTGHANVVYGAQITPVSPVVGWSATYQGWVADPSSPAGYTLTAAVQLVRL